MKIISIDRDHYPAVSNIDKQGMDADIMPFETSVTSWETWNEDKLPHSRLITVQYDIVLGCIPLSKVSNRCIYEGDTEGSIYVSESHEGKGLGKFLLQNLIMKEEAKE